MKFHSIGDLQKGKSWHKRLKRDKTYVPDIKRTESLSYQDRYSLHLISGWDEPGTSTKFCTVAVLLQSGVGASDYTVRVKEVCPELKLVVRCPATLFNPYFIHINYFKALDWTL